MITRDDLETTDLEPAPWGGAQHTIAVRMPDGWGGEQRLQLKMVSTKGLGGLKEKVKPREGSGYHVYGQDEHQWYGVVRTFDREEAIDDLLEWLNTKAVGVLLREAAPVEQVKLALERFSRALDVSSQLDPVDTWGDVVNLVCEIDGRLKNALRELGHDA